MRKGTVPLWVTIALNFSIIFGSLGGMAGAFGLAVALDFKLTETTNTVQRILEQLIANSPAYNSSTWQPSQNNQIAELLLPMEFLFTDILRLYKQGLIVYLVAIGLMIVVSYFYPFLFKLLFVDYKVKNPMSRKSEVLLIWTNSSSNCSALSDINIYSSFSKTLS
ncbi:hypothetical protein BY996DRAFT_7057141 [Phakopsora pachyrhizi]|nr:hypothetical protein BY996DRAFT_7057141 [Phakopsora pachyrhizi]